MEHSGEQDLIDRGVMSRLKNRVEPGRFDSKPSETIAVTTSVEVAPHIVAAPGLITGHVSDVVPIRWIGVDREHRMVRGAAADSAGPRIKYPLARGVLLVHVGQIAIREMLDEIVPTQFGIL